MRQSTTPECHFDIGSAHAALDALMRHTSDCIKVLDLDGRVVKWNDACHRFYGWSANEVIGVRLPHVPSELAMRTVADIRAIASAGRMVERETEAVRADGTSTVMKLIIIPIVDNDGDVSGVMSIAREATSGMSLERMRTEFATLVGRRLHDPLAAVASAAQLLARPEMQRDRARVNSTLTAIAERSRQAARFVDEMLVLADLAEGRLVIDREPVELYDLVTEVLGSIGSTAGQVVVDVDPGVQPVVGDPQRIAQAVTALIERAQERAPGEAVHVSLSGSGASVALSITEKRLQAADAPVPNGRVGSDEHARDDFGIALALARRVATAHGGDLRTEFSADGVRYTLRLPAVPC